MLWVGAIYIVSTLSSDIKMNYDNPAARLLSIIENGKKIDANFNCRAAWQNLLSVGNNNNPLLMSRLGKVMELPELIINALKEMFPLQGNTWSHWEAQVNSGFMSQDLNASWNSFIGKIDSHSITYLKLASDLLQAKSNTKILADDQLKDVRARLFELHEDIVSRDLDEDVKKYLSRYIKKILVSIDEYKITGALPLLETIETTVGHAHLHPGYKNFLTDTELGKKLLDTLASMANVVTVAVGVPQLSHTIALLAN